MNRNIPMFMGTGRRLHHEVAKERIALIRHTVKAFKSWGKKRLMVMLRFEKQYGN